MEAAPPSCRPWLVGSLCRVHGPCYRATVPFCYVVSPRWSVARKYKVKGGNVELSGNIVKGKWLEVAAISSR